MSHGSGCAYFIATQGRVSNAAAEVLLCRAVRSTSEGFSSIRERADVRSSGLRALQVIQPISGRSFQWGRNHQQRRRYKRTPRTKRMAHLEQRPLIAPALYFPELTSLALLGCPAGSRRDVPQYRTRMTKALCASPVAPVPFRHIGARDPSVRPSD